MVDDIAQFGVLSTTPSPPTQDRWPAGLHGTRREAGSASVLLVPTSLPAGPVSLMVLLHGATSSPSQVLPILGDAAEQRRFLVLAPKSDDYTWDAIRGSFGADVRALDQDLLVVFDHFEVDPANIVAAGFSDGASYALALGLANGQLFRSILAFSPGFVPHGARFGRPGVFITHGRDDRVLPIDRCGRRVAWRLRSEGYDVDYREFEGGHEVPPEAVSLGLDLLGWTG